MRSSNCLHLAPSGGARVSAVAPLLRDRRTLRGHRENGPDVSDLATVLAYLEDWRKSND